MVDGRDQFPSFEIEDQRTFNFQIELDPDPDEIQKIEFVTEYSLEGQVILAVFMFEGHLMHKTLPDAKYNYLVDIEKTLSVVLYDLDHSFSAEF